MWKKFTGSLMLGLILSHALRLQLQSDLLEQNSYAYLEGVKTVSSPRFWEGKRNDLPFDSMPCFAGIDFIILWGVHGADKDKCLLGRFLFEIAWHASSQLLFFFTLKDDGKEYDLGYDDYFKRLFGDTLFFVEGIEAKLLRESLKPLFAEHLLHSYEVRVILPISFLPRLLSCPKTFWWKFGNNRMWALLAFEATISKRKKKEDNEMFCFIVIYDLCLEMRMIMGKMRVWKQCNVSNDKSRC